MTEHQIISKLKKQLFILWSHFQHQGHHFSLLFPSSLTTIIILKTLFSYTFLLNALLLHGIL